MRSCIAPHVAISVVICLTAGSARAESASAHLKTLGSRIAAELARLCPAARTDDPIAYATCTAALRDVSDLPFAPSGILWGADQPGLPLARKQLTHLQPSLFRFLYLSLFSFTGRWSVGRDATAPAGFIRLEAYFRNALPPGEYPYPFWHSADKWASYEGANEVRFYLDDAGHRILAVTRSAAGSELNRGPYAHVTPPAFDGRWQWVDAVGHLQPHVSLFSNRYSPSNPNLAKLNTSYQEFGLQLRKGTCLSCHSPTNPVRMDHLVLLQTPLHAAAEIDDALKEVRDGTMPQNDLGLRQDLDPQLRSAIIQTGEEFRRQLRKADQWEAAHR